MRGEGAPRWVFAAMGAATLAYLHLDCLDGKQARRTASASPLGQLFDHGCDALCVHLLLVGIAPTLDVGFVPWSYGGQLAVAGPWLAAHWEEYHCGEMLYGNGWWGVTEANYTLVALHFASAVFGPSMWSRKVVDVAPRWLLGPVTKVLALLIRPFAFFFSGGGKGAAAGGGGAISAALSGSKGGLLLLRPVGFALARLGISISTSASSSSSSYSLSIASDFLSSLRINDLLLACIGGCGVLQITTQLWRVYVLDSGKQLPRAERGNKDLGKRAATKHLVQLALVVLVGAVTMGKNIFVYFESFDREKKEKIRPRTKKTHPRKKKPPEKKPRKKTYLIKKTPTGEPLRLPSRSPLHSRAAFAAFGLAYALEATKLIMDHMAKEPFEVVWWPLVSLSAGALHSAASRRRGIPVFGVSPDAIVYFNLAVISLGYLHYVTGVISETCSFLGIRCLTIDVERARRAKEEAAAVAEGRSGRSGGAARETAGNGGGAAASNGGGGGGGADAASKKKKKKKSAPAPASSASPTRRRSSSRSRK